MTEAARTADLIQKRLPTRKRGTMRFWGLWFGRPYDGVHRITSATAAGDELEIRFENGETLRVFQPSRAHFGEDGFTIGDAAALRWEWNFQGSLPAKRCFEEYVRHGDRILVTRDDGGFRGGLRAVGTEAAVEIFWGIDSEPEVDRS